MLHPPTLLDCCWDAAALSCDGLPRLPPTKRKQQLHGSGVRKGVQGHGLGKLKLAKNSKEEGLDKPSFTSTALKRLPLFSSHISPARSFDAGGALHHSTSFYSSRCSRWEWQSARKPQINVPDTIHADETNTCCLSLNKQPGPKTRTRPIDQAPKEKVVRRSAQRTYVCVWTTV